MFAVSFDDLKRKMLAPAPESGKQRVLLKKLCTAFPGTPEYDQYMNLFLLPENNTIHIQLEDDLKTATFYTIILDQKQITKELEAYYEHIREAESARRRPRDAGEGGGGFV